MGAPEWLASGHQTLPLIRLTLDTLLLPGEAEHIFIDRADNLAALDAAQDGCVGGLVITTHRNALAVAPLLEVRGISRRDVGAVVEVAAVGRVRVGKVENPDSAYHFAAHELTVVQDLDEDAPDDSEVADLEDVTELVERLRCAAELHESIRCKLAAAGGESEELESESENAAASPVSAENTLAIDVGEDMDALTQLPMDEAASQMEEELCVVDLDLAPATSLKRLHELWGVADEEDAYLQLVSFAACAQLSPVQRSMALCMETTTERLQYARRCLLKSTKQMAASLAVQEALSVRS